MIFFSGLKNKFGFLKLTIVELVGAFLIGILIACLTRTAYSANSAYIEALLYLDVGQLDKTQLLIFIMQYRVKEYLFIWLFSITVLAVPYNTIFVLYKGFTAGFVIGALSFLYGYKGMLYGLGLGMPHYVIYIIVLVQTVLVSYQLHERSSNGIYSKKSKLVIQKLPAFFLLLSSTVIGCFIETFINPLLVTWIKHVLSLG